MGRYRRSCRRTVRSIRYPRTPTRAVTPDTMSVMVATNGILHLEKVRALKRGQPASGRRADVRQHAAVIHDADPQHEGGYGHRLGQQRRIASTLFRPPTVFRREVETV